MAREVVGALDFLGLGKSLWEGGPADFSVDRDRGKVIKPTASFPTSWGRGYGTNPICKEECEGSESLKIVSSDSKSPAALSKKGFSSSSREGDMEVVGGTNRIHLDKPSKPQGDHTDTDTMLYTQEDSGDLMKGRAMQRNVRREPQGLVMRSFDTRQDEEKSTITTSISPQKNGVNDVPALTISSGLSWPLESTGLSHSSGSRANGLQPPRFNAGTSQATAGEETHGGSKLTGPQIDSTSLTLSIPSTREQSQATQSTGFGSPVPTYLRMMRAPDSSVALHGQRALQNPPQPAFQGGSSQVGSFVRPTTQTHLPGRPPTAQLTIFYSGMVNVYDDVPLDKAQAIMLLAGNHTWSSNANMNPPASVPARPPSTGGVPSSSSASAGVASMPAPSVTTSAATASPLVPAMLAPGVKPAAGVGPRTILPNPVELPQARKASLARFLEKRKDRVRGKGPYVPTLVPTSLVSKPGGASPPREKSPSPCNSKVRTRSPSPVNAAPNKKRSPSPINAAPSKRRSPSPVQRVVASQSSGSETSSPAQRPRTPQKAMQSNPPEEQASAGANRRRSKDEQGDWRNQQHSQQLEEKSQSKEEETASPSQRH